MSIYSLFLCLRCNCHHHQLSFLSRRISVNSNDETCSHEFDTFSLHEKHADNIFPHFFLPSHSSLPLSLFLFLSLSLELFTSLQQFVLCQLFPFPPISLGIRSILSLIPVSLSPFLSLYARIPRVSHPVYPHSSSCPFILVPQFPLSNPHHQLDVFGPFANNAATVLAPPRYFR